MSQGRVLYACPTYAGKEYALDAWVEGFKSQTYLDKFAYQVDNTRAGQQYFELIRSKGIDCTHLQPWSDWDRTFLRCWELILQRAKDIGAYWVMSVEADNVPAPEACQTMVDLALYGKVHLVAHAYPMHASAAKAAGLPEDSYYYSELGCTLMSRALLERTIEDWEEFGQMVLALWGTCDRYHGGYIKLTNTFKVAHLDGYEMAYPNLAPSTIPGLFFPGEMPADTGTQKPPCLESA